MKKKTGVASFYIVAFTTLILTVVAASFATVIISEVTRTSNDDLSQSAYDSALAGIEDAKVAFADYQRCVEAGAKPKLDMTNSYVTCEDIVYWMENPDCYMVGHILGRIPKTVPNENDNGEVQLGVTTSGAQSDVSVLNQAYTCVTIEKELPDYRSTITTSSEVKMVKIKFDQEEASSLDHIKLSWYTIRPETRLTWGPTRTDNGELTAAFLPKNESSMIVPPTVEMQLIQTAPSFSMDEIVSSTQGDRTDRATMFLVPNSTTGNNTVTAQDLLNSNNPQVKNLPRLVRCNDGSSSDEFACSVDIYLPNPIGGSRSNDTLMLALSLPYRQPETDFSVEFYCNKGTTKCGQIMQANGNNTGLMTIHDSQIEVDSTGRANDLFRRVKVRLESQDVAFPYPYYALQVLGDSRNYAVTKNMIVTCEHTLYDWNGVIGGSISSHANCE